MIRLFLLLMLFFSLAHAADDKAGIIKHTLQKNYQHLLGTVEQVNPSPMPSLYEVVADGHIFYTDENAAIIIDGQMFDLKTRRNLTEARARQLFAVEFDKLPLQLAIKRVRGNGSRKFATIEDPNCGFCKKLAQELTKLNDVTVYTFLYPIFNGSAEKVQAVWCSKDPAKAWDDLMLKGIQPKPGNCATPTAQVTALANKLRVRGTPALIFANGIIHPGYLPAEQLDQAINDNSK